MAKNKHTFAKRQRELKKQQKAEEKREKRRLKALGITPEDESEEGEGGADGETEPGTEAPADGAETPAEGDASTPPEG